MIIKELDLGGVPPRIERTSVKEMLSVSTLNGQTRVRINSSSLSVIQTCARKSWYVLERKLRAQSEAPATLFGSAIHAALEVFYSAPREQRHIPNHFRELSDTIPNGGYTGDELLFRAINQFCIKAAPLRSLPDSDKRSLTNGVWLLQNYFETYINDPFEVLCDKDGPITERTAEAVLYETQSLQITLFGTIDVVLENKQTGVVLPADHKTSSVVGNDFYNRLKPNHQYTGYLFLAQTVLGLQTDSFLVNCLQVKPKPKTERGSPPHFPRQVTKRSPEDMDEFRDVVVEAVQNYLRWKANDKWPLGDVNSCTMYGACQFLNVCGAPNMLRETMLEATFNEGHIE